MGSTDKVIVVDSREKIPLLFPSYLSVRNRALPAESQATQMVRLHTVKRELKTGDYVLEGSNGAAVERKKDLDELAGNLATGPGRRRFLDCLRRLSSEFRRPWILLEGDPLSLQKVKGPGVNPSAVRDLLLESVIEYNVGLMVLPSHTASHRRAVAEWVASILITGEGTCPIPSVS